MPRAVRRRERRVEQDHAAMQLLRLLLGKYPKAPEAQEARQYLTVLQNMARLEGGNRNA